MKTAAGTPAHSQRGQGDEQSPQQTSPAVIIPGAVHSLGPVRPQRSCLPVALEHQVDRGRDSRPAPLSA